MKDDAFTEMYFLRVDIGKQQATSEAKDDLVDFSGPIRESATLAGICDIKAGRCHPVRPSGPKAGIHDLKTVHAVTSPAQAVTDLVDRRLGFEGLTINEDDKECF